MRIGSLFSGAGGLDMAVKQVFGGEVVWHSEIDKAASKVLAYRYPETPNLGDIVQANWNAIEPVDVLCGGFPCQDVSSAGRRAGLADGTRSGLWAEMARIVGLLSPSWVVIENVKGLLSAQAHRSVESEYPIMGDRSDRPVLRAIGAVLGDLSELGYDAQWVTVAASDVGAPHRRERVFVLANTSSAGRPRGVSKIETGRFGGSGDEPVLLTTPQARDHKGTNSTKGGPWQSLPRDLAQLLPPPAAHDRTGARKPGQQARMQKPFFNLNDVAVNELLPSPSLSDIKTPRRGEHLQDTLTNGTHTVNLADAIEQQHGRDITRNRESNEVEPCWGKYEPAIRRWEKLTSPAPAPTELNRNGNPRLCASFSSWMMGWPPGWVTEPAIGISRADQLRLCGNGVVPRQAIHALQYLLQAAEVL